MNLYVARHGQTTYNAKNLVCGVSDAELTAQGLQQAEVLAQALQGCKIDLIITSPLRRAVATGEAVAARYDLPLRTDARLREQDYGTYEGMDINTAGFLENKQHLAYRYPQGESALRLACRVYAFLDELLEQHPDGDVLLVAHGGVCRMIRTYFCSMTSEEFFAYTPGNGTFETYRI